MGAGITFILPGFNILPSNKFKTNPENRFCITRNKGFSAWVNTRFADIWHFLRQYCEGLLLRRHGVQYRMFSIKHCSDRKIVLKDVLRPHLYIKHNSGICSLFPITQKQILIRISFHSGIYNMRCRVRFVVTADIHRFGTNAKLPLLKSFSLFPMTLLKKHSDSTKIRQCLVWWACTV